MPASSIDLYLQDARNNFDAVRPAPIPVDGTIATGQSQNFHISTNCYYGYHESKNRDNNSIDCEMLEVPNNSDKTKMVQPTGKKRSAEDADFPETKRLRQEVQKENIEPETTETMNVGRSTEELLELLYWNTHGGSMFHLTQCL